MDFVPFPKIARLNRNCVITEKIDGTNASVLVTDDGLVFPASRNRWISPGDDNFGFAGFVVDHFESFLALGPGRHFGEWWGSGIQRGYGLTKGEKRFSLFNTSRWNAETTPEGLHVVPVLYEGPFSTDEAEWLLSSLEATGSAAAPGFMKPEGIIVFHTAANLYFKATIEKDGEYKSKAA